MIRAALVALAIAFTGLPAYAENQQPGARFSFSADALPKPEDTPSVANSPDVIDLPPDAALQVPPGFEARLLARDVAHARAMTLAPNGDVFIARSMDGIVSLLREGTDGTAAVTDFATGFDRPFGLVIRDGYLYVADGKGVFRISYRDGDLKAAAEPEPVTAKGAFGDTGGPGGHWTRNLVFEPNGKHFYVSIGSKDNIGEDPSPRATIQMFDADGSHQRSFATGLRNAVGIAIYPGTGDLYAVVNERDGLGDGLVPDYFTRVADGGFYGWPYSYLGQNAQPGYAEKRPDLVAKAIVPDVLIQSHSAPLGLVFYTGTAFPKQYQGRAFIALHGSWNSSDPTGYKVISVPFENGKPENAYENFATGFRANSGAGQARVWGRPVGLLVDKDGALLISDDAAGTIWRVTYKGGKSKEQ